MIDALKKSTILIVDDNEMNREILFDILSSEYNVLTAKNGTEGLEIIRKEKENINLLLLDLVMPGLNGFEVLHIINENGWNQTLPIIMISSDVNEKNVVHAYELGVQDYINRPFIETIVHEKVLNVIKSFNKQRFLVDTLFQSFADKERYTTLLVTMLSQMIEYRNGESGLHVKHIGLITRILLEKLREKTDKYPLTDDDIEKIVLASAFHDIGKICVPSRILNKPGKLTAEEYDTMKIHTTVGFEMIDSIEDYRDDKLFNYVRDICRWHHERFDGRGFPDGLVGDKIPVWAQIVAIADVYDALTSKRCYKDAYSHDKSIKMIFNNECGIFNPILLECLEEASDEIKNRFENDAEKQMESRIREKIRSLAD